MKTLFAKSKDNGGQTLAEHTRDVLTVIEKMAKHWEFDVELAVKGAILHDLGKAHPVFQGQVDADDEQEDDFLGYLHRHEYSSLLFLPIFPKEIWDDLIELVAAHHKSAKDDAKGRGLCDWWNTNEHFIEEHIGEWEKWSPAVFELLETEFGINAEPFDRKTATEALEYAVRFCQKCPLGWSPLRGLLMAADHFASACCHDLGNELSKILKPPVLDKFHGRSNPLYPLSEIPTDDPCPHTLVVAPTGAGKTDFLFRRCRGRVFYTLPYQASINAMFERVKNFVPVGTDVRLQHATSKVILKGQKTEQALQKLTGSAVKILTPHQMASIIFHTPGYESAMLDLRGCDVVLDEIHTYSDQAMAMVLGIVKRLVELDCRIHVGTATMPTCLYKEVYQLLGGATSVYEVALPEKVLDTYDRHIVHKIATEEDFLDILDAAFAAGEKVLVVFNTIKRAQQEFERLSNIFDHVPAMLLHSRFRRRDRVALEKALMRDFNPDEKARPCLVVSTQVVEVSLDISFDRMITEAALIDALIQRFGRVNRVRTTKPVLKPVHILAPEGECKPYKRKAVEASFAHLPDGEVLKEQSIQEKINAVYPQIPILDISIHTEPLPKLRNNSKAILIEALDIEGAVCILDTDKAIYKNAISEDRVGLEIPVNLRALWSFGENLEQMKVGSRPFIVPRNPDYERLGLRLESQL